MNRKIAESLSAKLESPDQSFETPFKLRIVDAFLPKSWLDRIASSFPSWEADAWEHSEIGEVERKKRSTWDSVYDVPEGARDVVELLNSSIFLRALSCSLDIPKLIPDPYFTGGGLNISGEGDYLDVHVDGNYHDASGLNRRVNAILYLNPVWDRTWGGNFGMYSEDGSTLVREFSPKNNRLLIFDTSDSSFHGYPEPIQCPPDIKRKSLILYYYTKDAQSCETVRVPQPHSALWVKRGMRDKHFKKTRSFT